MINQKFKIIYTVIVILCLGIILSGCGKKNTIRIGHKNFTEQRILGQMFALLIEEHTNYKTDVKEFGSTSLVFEALKNNQIDISGEYTGTAYAAILNQNELKEPQAIYDYVKKEYAEQFQINWLEPIGFNNTYTFSVRKEIAEQYNLKTFSDLAEAAPNLRLGVTMEFLEREDGLPGVKKVYGGFEFKEEKALDPGLRYTAIAENEVDVIDAFSTDGKIVEYNLTILEDDKQFFPPYFVAPLIHQESAKNYPEIVEVLLKLKNQISDEEMQELNYKVDEKRIPEAKVAEEFLKAKGLIK